MDKPAENTITKYQRIKDMAMSPDVISRFEQVLGKRRAAAFLATLLNLVSLSKALQDCEPGTVMLAAMTAAAMDLPVDPNLGFAWIIPYKNKARFQMGYKGYIQLAHRTKQYEIINAIPVYDGEEVKIDRLTGKVTLSGEKASEEIIGYISYFRLLNGFERFVYRTKPEIIVHAKKYSKSWNVDDSPWKTHFDAMALKTVLKEALSRYGLLTIEMIRDDDEDEDSLADMFANRVTSVTTVPDPALSTPAELAEPAEPVVPANVWAEPEIMPTPEAAAVTPGPVEEEGFLDLGQLGLL